jgi:outer membrane immunogenic protein
MHLNLNAPTKMKLTNPFEFLNSRLLLAAALLCAGILAFAGTASAGPERWSGKDKTVAAVVEEPFNWTGFYFGAHVGGAWNDYNFGETSATYFAGDEFETFFSVPSGGSGILSFTSPGQDGGSNDSMIGGGQLGYQYQFGHFVVGVEGDFSSMSNSSDRVKFTEEESELFFFDGVSVQSTLATTRSAQTEWAGSARLKLGYAMGRLLLYATGGVSFLDAKAFAVDDTTTNFFVSNGPIVVPGSTLLTSSFHHFRTHEEEVLTGWTAGGGAEWAMTHMVTIGLEYRHNDWGDQNFFGHNRFPLSTSSTNVDFSGDQLTLRVNFLLGNLRQ